MSGFIIYLLMALTHAYPFISAGAIHSPHLLLLSGIGPIEALSKYDIPVICALPGVGQHLQDHPVVNAIFEIQKGELYVHMSCKTIDGFVKRLPVLLE